eukprot:CAMPEP_0203766908 /NCGR_PEP_ID=MMETSP0099_2-20121227/693_1 /ASSEMBLY_ACC=CAM_ASM_000209 /TAXON_ID=96639 /ORGANISM=" , Strain NY0313808BC1" /LENGTH=101 /DNA_ID=CAMNT_0050663339 /DNA_START=211 /DNA_END=513 /DNA_ORIENTATION=-
MAEQDECRVMYKICPAKDWEEAKNKGEYCGSGVDHDDGFIHFSTKETLVVTAEKFFAGKEGLVIVSVDCDKVRDIIKWEPARSGILFPHLYVPLPLEAVNW